MIFTTPTETAVDTRWDIFAIDNSVQIAYRRHFHKPDEQVSKKRICYRRAWLAVSTASSLAIAV